MTWALDARRGDWGYVVRLNGMEMSAIAARPDAILVYITSWDGGPLYCYGGRHCKCAEPTAGRHRKTMLVPGDVTVRLLGPEHEHHRPRRLRLKGVRADLGVGRLTRRTDLARAARAKVGMGDSTDPKRSE